MILFNKKDLEKELKENFGYYDSYKEFLDLSYDNLSVDYLPIKFSVEGVKKSDFIQEKAYKLDEKNLMLNQVFDQTLAFACEMGFGRALIFTEYYQTAIIPNNLYEYSSIISKIPNHNILLNVFGVALSIENERDYLRSILSIPFLLSYKNINVIPYDENVIYTVNHHLDLVKIVFKRR